MPFEAASNNENGAQTISLFDALCSSGLITETEKPNLESILKESGAALDQALSRLGLVTEDTLADFYAAYFNLPRWRDSAASFDNDLLRLANRRFLEKHRILPFSNDGDLVTAIMVDPANETGLHGLEFAIGAPISPMIATASEFDRIFASQFHEGETAPQTTDIAIASEDADKLKDLASAEPAVRLVNRLIVDAARARAASTISRLTSRTAGSADARSLSLSASSLAIAISVVCGAVSPSWNCEAKIRSNSLAVAIIGEIGAPIANSSPCRPVSLAGSTMIAVTKSPSLEKGRILCFSKNRRFANLNKSLSKDAAESRQRGRLKYAA